MKISASIEIEFLAGIDIKDVIDQAKDLASRLNVAKIRFSFNGIKFSIGANADTLALIKEYHNQNRHPYYLISG